jgi:periplasmic mercuric ion binding protein
MKRVVFFAFIFLFSVAGVQAKDDTAKTKTTCFKSSMHCAGCENTLFETLRFEKGVKEIKTDLESNTIKVVYDNRKNSPESLAKVIQKKGYKADPLTEEEYNKLVTPAKPEPSSK